MSGNFLLLESSYQGTFTVQIVVRTAQDMAKLQQVYTLLQQEEPVPRIDKVGKQRAIHNNPHKSLNETVSQVLSIVRSRFPERFSTGEASKVVKKELGYGRSTLGNVIRHAKKSHLIQKVGNGSYAFVSPAGTVNDSFLLDLVTDYSSEILQVFRVAERVSPALFLVVSQEGIRCRISDEKDGQAVDINLDKALFSTFHVAKQVSIGLDARALIERMQKVKSAPLHLSIDSLESASLQVGEYGLKMAHIEDSKGAIEPIEIKPKAQISIDREELARILREALVNAPYLDIVHDFDKATFANVTEHGDDFSVEIKQGFQCYEPSRSRYDIDSLLRVIKAASCKDIILKDSCELLSVQFNIREGILLQFLLGASPAKPVLRS